MGKASSNKKIAKAQRAGSKSTAGRQASLLYPISVTMVFILGILLVVVARNSRDSEATGPPRITDHWHAAYSLVVCDEFQPPILDETDPQGIHTHGDGVIHIHPFSEAAAGNDADLGRFFEASGLTVDDDKIAVPGGIEAIEGETKCGDSDGVVRVARWLSADEVATTEPQIFTDDFGSIRFLDDREAVTIFFGPEDAEIPPPDTIDQLDQLTDVGPDPTQELDPETGEPTGSEGPDGILGTDDDIISPGADDLQITEGEPSGDDPPVDDAESSGDAPAEGDEPVEAPADGSTTPTTTAE